MKKMSLKDFAMKKSFPVSWVIICIIMFLSANASADSIMINASDFVCGEDHTTGVDFYCGWYLHNNAGATYRDFFAPVHLPEGAQVTSLIVFYKDNSPSYINVRMARNNMYTNNVQTMAEWNTTGQINGWRTYKMQPVNYNGINNDGYGYFVYLYFVGTDQELKLRGVRINYTPGF